jgi:hypothetical protein
MFDPMSLDPRSSFGPRVAAGYDDTPRGDEAAAVAALAELAGDGPALELAVGTGRIAVPLAGTGIRVDGIELSPAMIERLRAKPGGAALTVAWGDMAVVEMPDRYRLVYIVCNSLMNLPTQDEQVRCVAPTRPGTSPATGCSWWRTWCPTRCTPCGGTATASTSTSTPAGSAPTG